MTVKKTKGTRVVSAVEVLKRYRSPFIGAPATDDKRLNDRAAREAALLEIVGPKRRKTMSKELETAEGVEEAARFMRQMREYAGLSQAELGKRLDVNQTRISELERGGSPEGVSYALLRRVARACGFADWPVAPLGTRVVMPQMKMKPRLAVELIAAGDKGTRHAEDMLLRFHTLERKRTISVNDSVQLIKDALERSPDVKVVD
jgi:transcriptional regulator with XRE-family HTH domain